MKVVKDDNEIMLSYSDPLTEELLDGVIMRALMTSPPVRPARTKKKPPSPKVLAQRRREVRKQNVLAARKIRAKRAAEEMCKRCGKNPPWDEEREDASLCKACLEYFVEKRKKKRKERQLEA